MYTVAVQLPDSTIQRIRAVPRGTAAWAYFDAATRHAPAGTRIAIRNADGRTLAAATRP